MAGSQIYFGREFDTGRRIGFLRSGLKGVHVQERGKTGGGKSVLAASLEKKYMQP